MQKLRVLLFCSFGMLILATSASQAAEATLGPEHKNLLATIQAIQLTDEQKAPFGGVIQTFFGDIKRAMYRDYRGATGKRREKKVKQAITRLYEELDEPIRKILRNDQWIAYMYYKGALNEFLLAQGYDKMR